MPKYIGFLDAYKNRPQSQPKLSQAAEDAFLERYFAGAKVEDLAREFGVSRNYYIRLLTRRGLAPRNRKKVSPPKKRKPTFEQRFHRRVDRSGGPDACWEWQGYRDPNGYGRVSLRGKHDYAHRVAWMLANGDTELPPKGVVVRHRCDNPPCCNPSHLVDGTQADNIRDREERRRGNRSRDVSERQREQIVELYLSGCPGTEVSAKTGVGVSSVYRILSAAGVAIKRQCRPYKRSQDLEREAA